MNISRTWQDQSLLSAAHGPDIRESIARSDRQLAEMVLAGDESAFEEIFGRHKRLVASIAARYFHRPEQVEEIIQISFTKMYFELANFRGAYELSLAGWLGAIARNACLDMLRVQKRKREDLHCELTEVERSRMLAFAANGPGAERAHIDRDLAQKLLARLAAEDRALLHMMYVEGLSVAEAAAALAWSLPKAKLRAWRARNALRRIMKRFL